MIQEVRGPGPFCLSDSPAEVFDSCCVGLASGSSNACEGGLTVNIPPPKAPEVRRMMAFEVFA